MVFIVFSGIIGKEMTIPFILMFAGIVTCFCGQVLRDLSERIERLEKRTQRNLTFKSQI
jgi:hypothetical protein